jgi:hypothetical protein
MTLREKLKWSGDIATHIQRVEKTQTRIAAGEASQECTYFWFVGHTVKLAIETYLDGNESAAKTQARLVVHAVLQFFYGDWRNQLKTPKGETGHEAWQKVCLWYNEVHRSLPFAAALSDWEAMKRIAEYPPEDKLPAVDKARGETAWSWAIVDFIRGESSTKVEKFLKKAEDDKAKRPKLLCPVLRALMNNDAAEFEKKLLAYLVYYRKSEFRNELMKLMALDGTTLYHLARKQGFNVKLPENVADHIICFD